MGEVVAPPLTCVVCDEPHVPFLLLQRNWEWWLNECQNKDLLEIVYSCIDYGYKRCRAHHVYNDVCDRFICSACYAKSSCECGKFIRCRAHVQKCSGCKKLVCNDGTRIGGCGQKCASVNCWYLFCTECREEHRCSRCRIVACDLHMPKCAEGENMCHQCLSGNCRSCARPVCLFHSTPCLTPTCQAIMCSACVQECSHCQASFCSTHMNKCTKQGCEKLLGIETTCLIATQCTCCGKYYCSDHKGYNHSC